MLPKFRIWDKSNKCWATDFTISLDGELLCDNGSTCFISDHMILMPWTGLQINNQDLYWGDIVRKNWDTVNGAKTETGIIEFGEHETSDDYYASTAYGFFIKFISSPFSSTVDALPSRDLEIIGNIYQNSELLND